MLQQHAPIAGWRDYVKPPKPVAMVSPWRPAPLKHEHWPPDYKAVYAWRMKVLAELHADPSKVEAAKLYYSTRPGAFIMDWMDTYDPRKPDNKWMPFVFFWRQDEFIEFLHELRNDGENGQVEKCRDAGATWLACGYSIWSWIFVDNDAIGWGSRKQDLVDKIGDPSSIFEKLRKLVHRLPSVFKPARYATTFMKFINHDNGSLITGEAGDNIGRGGRTALYFKDEAQTLDSKVLTPSGFSTMGQMKVGTAIIGSDGTPARVTHINEVGFSDVFRVTFSDGTSARCSPNHLWNVESVIGKNKRKTLRTVELLENYVYKSPGGQTQYRYRVPVVAPVVFAHRGDLPLDPYIVGALLGDGSVTTRSIKITTIDPFIVDEFRRLLPNHVTLRQEKDRPTWRMGDVLGRQGKGKKTRIYQAVIDAGIFGARSWEKSIPDKYLMSSPENRLAVLQGLMDTDGSAANSGAKSFHTSSPFLADDVKFLVQSLGGTATVNIKKDARGFRDQHVLHLNLTGCDLFRLPRKVAQATKRQHPPGRKIVKIERDGHEPVRCITTSAPDGLYVTDDFIITHNSAHYDRPELIEAALGDNTNVQVDISSVNGLGNIFHRRRESAIEWSRGTKIKSGETRLFIIDWKHHPDKTQEWYDTRKAKSDREGMQHVFAQEVDRDYAASVTGTIIKLTWLKECVDAHNRIPYLKEQLVPNVWAAGLDVADEGADRNALSIRQWIIVRKLVQWGEYDDVGVACRNTVKEVSAHKGIAVQYDSIGIGAGVKSEYNRLLADPNEPMVTKDRLRMVPWNAGAAVVRPYQRIIEDDEESLTNKDFFANFKAQAWWSFRTRVYKTYRAVKYGEVYRPDELVSFDKDMPLLDTLLKELAQAVRGKSGGLRVIVDKAPDGMKSPDLADSTIMSFFPAPEEEHVLTGDIYS